MKLSHLKSVLPQRADFRVSFQLPDGWRVPARAHVTRGARIDKQFLDCGGTLRADSKGRLQTRVADDLHHRLTAGKLLRILEKAAAMPGDDDLQGDLEHEARVVSQYPVRAVEFSEGEGGVHPARHHAAGLAEAPWRRRAGSPLRAFLQPLPRFS